MVRILVFGDSITYGAWDKECGWVQRLRKFLDERDIPNLLKSSFYCLVYNLGISGDNTEYLLERFELETRERLEEGDETIIIFSIGINDSQFNPEKNTFNVSPEKFQSNIKKLFKLAKSFSSKIVFVGLTPVDEEKTLSWNINESYKNSYVQKYNEIIRSVCKENKIYFVEIFDELIKDYRSFLEDGLHPNSEGHKRIFEIVKDFLIKNNMVYI